MTKYILPFLLILSMFAAHLRAQDPPAPIPKLVVCHELLQAVTRAPNGPPYFSAVRAWLVSFQALTATEQRAYVNMLPWKELIELTQNYPSYVKSSFYQLVKDRFLYWGPDANTRKELFRWALESKNSNDTTLDVLLGLNVRLVSLKVASTIRTPEARQARFGNEEIWQSPDGAGMSDSMTDYASIHKLFSRLRIVPGQRVIDMGSGFGRVGLYLGIMYPGVRFTGFEIVSERVEEANRVKKLLELGDEIEFKTQDLSAQDFTLPLADFYYAFCPVNEQTGLKLWNELGKLSASFRDLKLIYKLALDKGQLERKSIEPFEVVDEFSDIGFTVLKRK